MRRAIITYLLFLSVFSAYGSANCDSIKVLFALNKATFDPTLNNNALLMEEFIDGIAASAKAGSLDHIAVYGYASPEGPFRINDRLSRQRCKAVAAYISRRAGIPLNSIQTYPGGVAWDGLRDLVAAEDLTPSRDEVLRILDEYLPGACTDRALSDRCRQSLTAIDNGRSFKWMLANLYPKLRYSLGIYTYYVSDSVATRQVIEGAEVRPVIAGVATIPESLLAENEVIFTPPILSDQGGFGALRQPLHRLAIKTNLLYDAALLPNLEVEYRASKNWSVALEGGVAWWGRYSKERSYRLAMVSPEVKYWIRPRAPWHGLYAGVFAGGTLYDFEKGTPGYRGEGAFGGLSLGYMWPVSRCLSLEAAVGAGYLFTRYKEYAPIEGHHVYQRTKNLNYFGPLKVKFSLVWRLWDANKPARINAAQEQSGL